MIKLRHYFNKIIIILTLVMMIVFILPYGVGLKLYGVYPNQLAYVKPIKLDKVEKNEIILYRNTENEYYFSKVSDKNNFLHTLTLEEGQVISENALEGRKVLILPYVGSLFLFLMRMEYDVKLMVLLVILLVEIIPEFINIFLKNRAFKTI